MTNLDRIRAMTADELAEFFKKITTCRIDMDFYECPCCRIRSSENTEIAEWLKSEVIENG